MRIQKNGSIFAVVSENDNSVSFHLLMKIYTKTGDKGQTGLIGGKRVSKNDLRLEAYGCIDELNANLALLRTEVSLAKQDFLLCIQQHLFRIGTQLATPKDCSIQKVLDMNKSTSDISQKLITELECQIDLTQAALPEQHAFVIPGGNRASAICHVCRTVCRRAERSCVAVQEVEMIDPLLLCFLNRLSDYLFVLSRKLCLCDGEEQYWDGH